MRVLLVDNRTLFLQGLQSILQAGGIDVVGMVLNGEEALAKARVLKPDIIILNISGDGRDSFKTMRRAHKEIPEVRFIGFADSSKNLRAVVRREASGYLLTEIRSHELLNKLHELEVGAVKH